MAGNIVAQWLFENNLNDSSGNGNTLTGGNSPTYDNTNYIQGSYSLNLVRASSQYAYISDANLAAGFPLKNGATNPTCTIGVWFRPTALTAASIYYLWEKGSSYKATLVGPDNMQIGYGNTSVPSFNPNVVLNSWNFLGVSKDNVSNALLIQVWNIDLGLRYEGVYHLPCIDNPDGTRFTVGASSGSAFNFQGQIDYLTVLDGPLNRDELEALKNQSLPATAQLVVSQVHAQIEYTPSTTNDYSNDSSCVAAWLLENGALTTDSKSTNTLTDTGISADTSDFKEGAASASFDGTNYLHIADASLATGFPTKNGDTTKLFSVCGFFKTPSSLPGSGTYQTIVGKRAASTKTSWWIYLNNSRVKFAWYTNTTGTATYYDLYASNLATSTWYFFCVAVDGVNKTFQSWVWNAGTGVYWGGASQTPAAVLVVSDAKLCIGAIDGGTVPYPSGGKIDSIVMFNRLLTSTEANLIRALSYAGTYPASGQIVSQVLAQVEYEEPPQIRVEQLMAQVEYDETASLPINDISSVASRIAHWKFEPGVGFLADSINSQTLTAGSTVVSDPLFFKSGQGSAWFDGAATGKLTVADASLVAGFPFKNGDTGKKCTVSLWWHPAGNANKNIIGKWANNTSAGRSWFLYGTGGYLNLIYYNGTSNTTLSVFGSSYCNILTTGWQRITLVIDNDAALVHLHCFFANGDSQFYGTAALTSSIVSGTDPFSIGNTGDGGAAGTRGWIDDVVLFNESVFNFFEIGKLSQNTFTGKRGANNFTGWSSLKGNWQANNAAPLDDSSGNGNTLTKFATFAGDHYWEFPYAIGSAQDSNDASLGQIGRSNSVYYYRNDSDLSSGFPLKNGDTSKKLTWCCFYRPIGANGDLWPGVLLSKKSLISSGNTAGLALFLKLNADPDSVSLCVKWCDGITDYEYDTGIDLSSEPAPNTYGTQYHIAIVADGVAKTFTVRVYDAATGTIYTYSATPPVELAANNVAFVIGKTAGYDSAYQEALGAFDEVLVFNDTLSASDIDKIREGTLVPTAIAATPDVTALALTQLDAAGTFPLQVLLDALSVPLTQLDAETVQRLIVALSETNLPITQETVTTLLRSIGSPSVSSLALTQEDVTPFYTYCRKFPVYPDERIQETQTGKRSFPNRR